LRLVIPGLVIAVLLAGACDPCAGTVSCHTEPELSYTGQFIEFPSGKAIASGQCRVETDSSSCAVAR
jgi:hypothetical protein